MKQTNLENDPLRAAALDYRRTGNLAGFMAEAYMPLLRYCKRLNRDPDIIYDFFIHIYSRSEQILHRYHDSYFNRNFTGYFFNCVRNEFFNYIRTRRAKTFNHSLVESTDWFANVKTTGDFDCFGNIEEAQTSFYNREELVKILNMLEDVMRIPFRLYYGFEIDAEDMKFMERKLEQSVFDELMKTFHERKEKRERYWSWLKTRSTHLSFLITKADLKDKSSERLRRWKKRIEKLMSKTDTIFTLHELGTIFGVSKTTIARRIERVEKIIREKMRLPEQE